MQRGRLEYFVPVEAASWSKVFGILEKIKEELQIEDYAVTQTTLERVTTIIYLNNTFIGCAHRKRFVNFEPHLCIPQFHKKSKTGKDGLKMSFVLQHHFTSI
ncbi:hypothetical protein Avbf_02275 [Armadillidium vulgare]|nr:hypothetical protein Avbf_02275 [Armadillidium vulgare]